MKRVFLSFFIFILILSLPLNVIFSSENENKEGRKLALVLSGGGARGIAHIAVIKELERRGIVPDMVLGTSIGALVGGFYASGYTGEQIEELLKDNNIVSIILNFNNRGQKHLENADSEAEDNLFVINFSKNGIGNNNGVLDDHELNGFFRMYLSKVSNITDFDKLSIPFRCVGINAVDGERVVFDGGSIYTALRSSMSLPVFFAPVKIDNETYVMDGGMSDNMPVDIAKELGADVVIAVDVNDAFNYNQKTTPAKLDTLTGAFDAFSWMVTITNTKPQYEVADYVLVPNVNEFTTLQFDKAQEILQRGEDIVAQNPQVFDELEKEFGNRKDKTFLEYKDRPYLTIENVDKNGLNSHKELNVFIGKEMTPEILEEFEKVLEHIRSEERLKLLSYSIEGGVLRLEPVDYPESSGVVALGGLGEVGVMWNGYNSPYFAINPNASASAQTYLTANSLISFALIYNGTVTFETRYSNPLEGKELYFNTGFDFNYLNLSYNTSSLVFGHTSKNDIGATIKAGFAYVPTLDTTTSFNICLDYVHLARIMDPYNSAEEIVPWNNIVYLYGRVAYKYHSNFINTKLGFIDVSAKANFTFGPEWDFGQNVKDNPHPHFSYLADGTVKLKFGPEENQLITEFEVVTNRRFRLLKNAYTVTKGGIITPDYLYGMLSYQGRAQTSNFYWELGVFVEAFQKKINNLTDYEKDFLNLIPFFSISDFSLGPRFEMEYKTDFGSLFLEAFVPINKKTAFSIMFGFR